MTTHIGCMGMGLLVDTVHDDATEIDGTGNSSGCGKLCNLLLLSLPESFLRASWNRKPRGRSSDSPLWYHSGASSTLNSYFHTRTQESRVIFDAATAAYLHLRISICFSRNISLLKLPLPSAESRKYSPLHYFPSVSRA